MATTLVKQLQQQFGEVIRTATAKPNAQWYNAAAFSGLSVHFDPESQMRVICNSAQRGREAEETLANLQELLDTHGIAYQEQRQAYNLMPSNQRAYWSAICLDQEQCQQLESLLSARQSSTPRHNL